MDADRFDARSRALARPRSRRGIARLLGTLAVAGWFSTQTVREALAATRVGGTTCRLDTQCRTGRCLRDNTCSCSRGFPKCQQPANPCQKATCNVATTRCVIGNKRNGLRCGDGKVCYRGSCCTPKCAGKECGPDSCGGTCGSCVAPETCRSGVCSCGVGKELCGGACVDMCAGDLVRNPDECNCCLPPGAGVFGDRDDCLDAGCCAGQGWRCQPKGEEWACDGRSFDSPCTFNAQCRSGKCEIVFNSPTRRCAP